MKSTRRSFLGGAATAPFFIGFPRGLFAATGGRRPAAADRINLAVIGCGTMAHSNVNAFLWDKRVRIAVACDPILEAAHYSYDGKARGGRKVIKEKVDKSYGNSDCRMTADWREVIDDPTIDAVQITCPDHWHALIAIAAMRKGKHVYCQKPMCLGVSEGIAMTRVAKESGVTFQVGSQHRSNSACRQGAELVASGYIGKCRRCTVGLPPWNGGMWGTPKDRTRTKPPAYFDTGMWDLWQGPAAHWPDNAFIPGIHSPLAWRWNSRTGGGIITDWGAHWIDLLQWTLGTDRTGPVAIENMTTDLDDDEVFDWAQNFDYDMVYADGFVAHVSSKARNGLTFHGEKGDIYFFPGKLERPEFLAKWSEKKDLKDTDRHLYRAKDGHGHEMDFVDGIYENRPVCTDCEIGHRSIAACHIANICERLRLKKLTWDPAAERFTGDHAAEANRLLEVPHANGWKLA